MMRIYCERCRTYVTVTNGYFLERQYKLQEWGQDQHGRWYCPDHYKETYLYLYSGFIVGYMDREYEDTIGKLIAVAGVQMTIEGWDGLKFTIDRRLGSIFREATLEDWLTQKLEM